MPPEQPEDPTGADRTPPADLSDGAHHDDVSEQGVRPQHDDVAHEQGQPVAGRGREPRRRSGLRHVLREVLIVGGTALIISFLIKTFVVQAFWIPSGSMEDTLIYGDRVMVAKIQAGPTEIERGDIAVFLDPGGWLMHQEVDIDRGPVINVLRDGLEFVGLAPAGESNHLIKRVIGMSGDHIVCCDEQGRITVNDEPLEESYLYPGDEPSLEAFDVVVPEDHFWMMGDHRSNSRDSRANDDGTGAAGSVPADHMVGQAMVLVWPLDRWDWFGDGAGEVFADVPAPESGGSGS